MDILIWFLTIEANTERSKGTSVAVFMFFCVGNMESNIDMKICTEVAYLLFLKSNTYCKMTFANGFFICHLYVSFSKTSIHVFCPFHSWVVCYLSIEYIYIYIALVLCQIYDLHIFSSL